MKHSVSDLHQLQKIKLEVLGISITQTSIMTSGLLLLALSDTLVFLLNEYFNELNTANF